MDLGNQDQTNEYKQANNEETNQEQHVVNNNHSAYLTVEFYTPYFNVTGGDILERILTTFNSLEPVFLNNIRNNPDLWGPIWINATIIFITIAMVNSNQIGEEKENKSLLIRTITYSTGLLYIIVFGMPVVLVTFMKSFGVDLSLPKTICIYGYSMITLLIVTLVYFFFNEQLWLLIAYGFVDSSIFLIVNLKEELNRLQNIKKYIIIGIIMIIQLSLYSFYTFVFFQFEFE